jgi:hypothetical protein
MLIIILLRNKTANLLIINHLAPLNYVTYNTFQNNYPVVITYNVPIYIFYHICPKSDDNKHHITVIDEQINDLIQSGLYDKCHTVYYGCSCEKCDEFLNDYLSQYSKFKKLESAIVPCMKSYENVTINAMLEFTKKQKHPFYGFYMHTKGTSSVSESQQSWRRFMMYFLVRNYKLCLDIMKRGFYTCGVNYNCKSLFIPNHYGGNFFWFSSEYVKTLDPIQNVENSRFDGEFWLMSKYVKNKNVCIYKERYISVGIPDIHVMMGMYYFQSTDYYNKKIDVAVF